MAREGKTIPYGRYGDKVVVMPRRKFIGAERQRIMLKADQIICGTNKTRAQLNEEMRRYLGIAEENLLPTDGEKVICTVNNWEKPLDNEERFHLVNGIIGKAKNARDGMDLIGLMEFSPDLFPCEMTVPFDTALFTQGAYAHGYNDRAVILENGEVVHERNKSLLKRVKAVADEPICRFEFAYAITCHKAQGSEFDFVVVFDESGAFGEERNKWLYTAITRAKDKLLIVR
ncbi:MAG: ATP-binding domain-containing protein [Clostridia bacterium]|nr:ATP-binding domain-containing protein [Clostridia bacterium]